MLRSASSTAADAQRDGYRAWQAFRTLAPPSIQVVSTTYQIARSLNGTTALTIVMNGTDFELSFNDILVPVRTLLHILRKYMNMCWHDALELIVAFMQSIHE